MLRSKRRWVGVVASASGLMAGGAIALARAPGMPTLAAGRSAPSTLAQLEQHLRQEQLALDAQTSQLASTKKKLALEAAQLTAEAAKLKLAAAQAPPATHATTGASGGGDGGGSGGDS